MNMFYNYSGSKCMLFYSNWCNKLLDTPTSEIYYGTNINNCIYYYI